MKKISGLNQIIDKFDTFILDQWGVLHNGGDAFEQAVEALHFLKKHNKKVVILSNSGNTHQFSYGRLEASGISRELYIDVLTSGDHMRHNFNTGKFDHLGKNALFFSWDDNDSVLTDCKLNNSSIDDASFVLCYGVGRNGDVASYMDDLRAAYERKLELVVSNPDLVAMRPDGLLTVCPGSVATTYEAMGGKVHWHGKPQREIYTMCKKLVGGWENAIAVGDSLEHDIAGARSAGISSLFITSGIHATALSNESNVTDLTQKFDIKPSHFIDWFKI